VSTTRTPAIAWTTARRRKLRVRDFDCHVIELGDEASPPLLLVHGWPQVAACWRHVAPALARHFHVVMPDLRGLGQSTDAPLAPGQGCKEELAKDLIALLDAMGLDKVYAIGHDWGGWTTAIATLRYPQRFHAYICLGVPHLWRKFDLVLLRHLWRF
jgi:pimeloyl-ACP methyl ester carboxylesterase